MGLPGPRRPTRATSSQRGTVDFSGSLASSSAAISSLLRKQASCTLASHFTPVSEDRLTLSRGSRYRVATVALRIAEEESSGHSFSSSSAAGDWGAPVSGACFWRRGSPPGSRRPASLLAAPAHADRKRASRNHGYPIAQHVPIYRPIARYRDAGRRRPRRLPPVAAIHLARPRRRGRGDAHLGRRPGHARPGPRVRRDGDLRAADLPRAGLRPPGGVGTSPARNVRAGPAAAAAARCERPRSARWPAGTLAP